MTVSDTHADTIREMLSEPWRVYKDSMGQFETRIEDATEALAALDALVAERDRAWPTQLHEQYLAVLDERDKAVAERDRERARADAAVAEKWEQAGKAESMGRWWERERARADRVEAILLGALAVVDEQAEDDGLWALNLDGTQPIVEAYLAQELRRLHAAVEHASAALSAGSGGRGTTP